MPIKKVNPVAGIILPTDSFYGDLRDKKIERRHTTEQFCFPEDWEVWVCEPEHLHEYSPLSEKEIVDVLEHPTNSPPLPELARGKHSIAIIVDDLSRPTPAYKVIPSVIEQLKKGDVAEEDIFFIIGGGQHRPLVKWDDMEKVMKLGAEIVERFTVFDHDALDDDTYDIERPDGPTIRLDKHLRDAELVIGIGGIHPHGGAGFGGGAKIIVPGVSHQETISYNHKFPWEGYGKIYPEKIEGDCIRKDAEIVAGYCLDFIVNIVMDPYKRILHLAAGNFITAHRKGCHVAKDAYLTNLMPETPDIVVANSYPFDTDLGQSGRGKSVFNHHSSSIQISIAPCYDQIAYHGHPEGWKEFLRRQELLETTEAYEFQGTKGNVNGTSSFLYSVHLNPKIYYQSKQSTVLFDSWDELIKAVKKVCPKTRPIVAIYPYSSLQLWL
jgi:nickel-dependent lactate racemase